MDNLKNAIETIENAGGFVILPDTEEEMKLAQAETSKKLAEAEKEQKKVDDYNKSLRISVSNAMKMHELTWMEYDRLLDSVIPACCADGCEVEPDGHFEHGHPSILLAMVMI